MGRLLMAIRFQPDGESPERHKVEPLDVPAVQETVSTDQMNDCRLDLVKKCVRQNWCESHNGVCAEGDPCLKGQEWYDAQCRKKLSRWTCSDKRRVLLTDESGKRHCILFGEVR